MSRYALLLILFIFSATLKGEEQYADPKLTDQDRSHWSFVKPKKVRIEAPGNPVDALIQARLKREGLKPSPRADRITLIRRVTLDLTGLPPTPKEVAAFVKDHAPDAYEKVVDRLLASPHFGERWAQHWLDVVRFAESNGYEVDGERPHAWRYRDYVVKSFNADKPYDQFLTEQIAGDELAAGKEPRDVSHLWVASGLHRCGPVHLVSGNLDPEVLRQERLTEMVNGVGSTFLGLTVGCARCHDHKFDPFSAGDYYRLQAFFAPVAYAEIDLATDAERQERKKQVDALNAQITPIKAKIATIDAPYRATLVQAKKEKLEPKYREALDTPADKRTPIQKKLVSDANSLLKVSWDEVLAAMAPADRTQRAELRDQFHALEARMPPPTPSAWAIKANEGTPQTFVLKRGDPARKLAAVGPAFPRVVTTDAVAAVPKTRLELAKWMCEPEHPLTARVIVNRLWQHHFGVGIVASPNDFGIRGEKPTHPELLDWLACDLIERKWSLKHIHRLIVLSETYQQSATTNHGEQLDASNKLLWRMNRKRLEAEAIRDSVLAAAGTLNTKIGGRAVRVPLEPEVYDLIFTEGEPDGLWPVTPDRTEHTRRSIYLFNKRNVRLPMFEALDFPDTLNSCAVRPVSTFAPQALILMNGPFVQEQGKALAMRLVTQLGQKPDAWIDEVFRSCFGRTPKPQEKQIANEFLAEQTQLVRDRMRARLSIGLDTQSLPPGSDPSQLRALADLCMALFNTHEFVYLP